MKKILPLSVALIALLLLATCEREWSNPFDPNNTLDPEAWAPQNLQIETTSITERKLTWTYNGPATIQGFKIDRKKGDEPWQVGYQVFEKSDRSFLDTITLNPSMRYNYKLYTYAGGNISTAKDTSFVATIPPPNNLTFTSNSVIALSLIWSYNFNGCEGFKIERRHDAENWELIANVIGTSYTDDAFELNTDLFYRVAAYHGQYYSDFVENNFNSQIPVPENLTIKANSATSITLNWSYNFTGQDGFKIERKIDNGSWEMLLDSLNPNQKSFTDNGLNLQTHIFNYRILAFSRQHTSKQVEFPHLPFLCGIQKIMDLRDGNQYETVQIGNHCWMKENLKWLPAVNPSSYSSHTSYSFYVSGYQGTNVASAKATANYETFGVLYNWPAALNACPDGWHLPSDNEWTILIDYLGGSIMAGGKMKTIGTFHWLSPNTGATNESGFSGLPGGERITNGYFLGLGSSGYWWSATEYPSSQAWCYYLYYFGPSANRNNFSVISGFSVRCLKDE